MKVHELYEQFKQRPTEEQVQIVGFFLGTVLMDYEGFKDAEVRPNHAHASYVVREFEKALINHSHSSAVLPVTPTILIMSRLHQDDPSGNLGEWNQAYLDELKLFPTGSEPIVPRAPLFLVYSMGGEYLGTTTVKEGYCHPYENRVALIPLAQLEENIAEANAGEVLPSYTVVAPFANEMVLEAPLPADCYTASAKIAEAESNAFHRGVAADSNCSVCGGKGVVDTTTDANQSCRTSLPCECTKTLPDVVGELPDITDFAGRVCTRVGARATTMAACPPDCSMYFGGFEVKKDGCPDFVPTVEFLPRSHPAHAFSEDKTQDMIDNPQNYTSCVDCGKTALKIIDDDGRVRCENCCHVKFKPVEVSKVLLDKIVQNTEEIGAPSPHRRLMDCDTNNIAKEAKRRGLMVFGDVEEMLQHPAVKAACDGVTIESTTLRDQLSVLNNQYEELLRNANEVKVEDEGKIAALRAEHDKLVADYNELSKRSNITYLDNQQLDATRHHLEDMRKLVFNVAVPTMMNQSHPAYVLTVPPLTDKPDETLPLPESVAAWRDGKTFPGHREEFRS